MFENWDPDMIEMETVELKILDLFQDAMGILEDLDEQTNK